MSTVSEGGFVTIMMGSRAAGRHVSGVAESLHLLHEQKAEGGVAGRDRDEERLHVAQFSVSGTKHMK